MLRHLPKVSASWLLTHTVLHDCSLKKKDGTSEADVIYANPSDANLALGLSPCQLGDKSFVVTLEENDKRLNLKSSFRPTTPLFDVDLNQCRTLIALMPSEYAEVMQQKCLQALNDASVTAPALYSIESCVDGKGLLMEFPGRQNMLDAIKVLTDRGIRAMDVIKAVDPDARISELEDVMIYGVPMGKLLAASNRSTAKGSSAKSSHRERSPRSSSHRSPSRRDRGRSPSRRGDRSPRREKDRSRSPRRDKDRSHRHSHASGGRRSEDPVLRRSTSNEERRSRESVSRRERPHDVYYASSRR